jgi:hypothetical protein
MEREHTVQRELFASRPAWEEHDTRQGMIATVVLPTGVDRPLDYLVPEELAAAVEPGRRVRVPLGRGAAVNCPSSRSSPSSRSRTTARSSPVACSN